MKLWLQLINGDLRALMNIITSIQLMKPAPKRPTFPLYLLHNSSKKRSPSTCNLLIPLLHMASTQTLK
jgi:hypothetical protein